MACFSLQILITEISPSFYLSLLAISCQRLCGELHNTGKTIIKWALERTNVKLIAVNLIFTYSELFVQPSGESSPLYRSLRLGYICTGHWPQSESTMLAWHTWPDDREPKQTVFVTFAFWSQGAFCPFCIMILFMAYICLVTDYLPSGLNGMNFEYVIRYSVHRHTHTHTHTHEHKQTLHTLKQVPYPRGKVVNITQRSWNHNKDPGNKMWYFSLSLSLCQYTPCLHGITSKSGRYHGPI